MSGGVNLAETTIFIPKVALECVIGELKEAGLEVLPHPAPATHYDKDGSTTFGLMVDVLGFYPPLAQILARTLTANGLDRLNNPAIIFPFE